MNILWTAASKCLERDHLLLFPFLLLQNGTSAMWTATCFHCIYMVNKPMIVQWTLNIQFQRAFSHRPENMSWCILLKEVPPQEFTVRDGCITRDIVPKIAHQVNLIRSSLFIKVQTSCFGWQGWLHCDCNKPLLKQQEKINKALMAVE